MLPSCYSDQIAPPDNHLLPGRGVPVLFKVGMALRPRSKAVVMAEAAFKRLKTGPMQFAHFVPEKIASHRSIKIDCKFPFAAFECGRENAEIQFR